MMGRLSDSMMLGIDVFDFDGITYEPKRDHQRLKGQMLAVFELMRDGQWRTLHQINAHVNGTESAISARLRDLRKEKFGGHVIERRHTRNGLFEYRLSVTGQ